MMSDKASDFLNCEHSDFVSGFRVRKSEKVEPVWEMILLEGAPC